MIRLPIYPGSPGAPVRGHGGRDAGITRNVELTIDDERVVVLEGTTILGACELAGNPQPTLCFAKNLTPINACRICVVEVQGARTLVPSCSRKAESGMVVQTRTPRVRTSRKLVLELLASSVDLSATPGIDDWLREYGADPARFGPPQVNPAPTAGVAPIAEAGHHHDSPPGFAATVRAKPTVDNDLFVRDYGKCILCYKCVQACGSEAQHSFAIAVAGRGFGARIATEYQTPLPDSACVFCGNCIGVCPTGALVFSQEYELRAAGAWDEKKQREVSTVCPYCGVGCVLTLRSQDNQVVRVTSPADSEVTSGHLCIKGRFGWQYVGVPKPPAGE